MPKRVALLGTMATQWRKGVTSQLLSLGYEVLDNTDERWLSALTAEEKLPLLQQDIEIVKKADIVLWHHDSETQGATARIELGYLPGYALKTLVHVNEGVTSREYMQAFVMLHPDTMVWVTSLNEAVRWLKENK